MRGEKRSLPPLLLFILLGAAVLRFYGVTAEVSHPDAPSLVQPAMYLAPGHARMGPFGHYGLYVWPATPIVALLALVYTGYFALGYLAGWFSDASAFAASYLSSPHTCYSIASAFCTLFGIGTVWLVFRLGRRLYDERIGIVAAALVAGSFLASMESQIQRPDVPSTFVVLIALFFCLNLVEQGGNKPAVIAAAIAGASVAFKYTSGLVVVPLGLAHLLERGRSLVRPAAGSAGVRLLFGSFVGAGGCALAAGLILSPARTSPWLQKFSPDGTINTETLHALVLGRQGLIMGGAALALVGLLAWASPRIGDPLVNFLGDRRLWLMILAFTVTFLLLDPLFVFEPMTLAHIFVFDQNFLGLSRGELIGVERLPGLGNFWWYLTGSMTWGMGLPVAIFALLGLALTIRKLRREDLLFLLFPILYFITIGFGKLRWERYVVTLVPFMGILAARAIVTLVDRIGQSVSRGVRNAIISIVVIASLCGQVWDILRYDHLLLQPDTRVLAPAWIVANLPAGSKIAQESHTGQIMGGNFEITNIINLPLGGTLADYRAKGYDFLVVSDTQYNRNFAEADAFPQGAELYRRLFAEATLVKEFDPDPNEWPPPDIRFSKYHIHTSPTIRIYKLKP